MLGLASYDGGLSAELVSSLDIYAIKFLDLLFSEAPPLLSTYLCCSGLTVIVLIPEKWSAELYGFYTVDICSPGVMLVLDPADYAAIVSSMNVILGFWCLICTAYSLSIEFYIWSISIDYSFPELPLLSPSLFSIWISYLLFWDSAYVLSCANFYYLSFWFD